EEHRRRSDARRDIAEHVELRAAGPVRALTDHDRDAAGLQRRAHRAANAVVFVTLAPARLAAATGKAPAQLRDDAMHRRKVCGRTARQGPVELAERSRRRQRLGALDLRALELAAQHRLDPRQRLALEAPFARVGLAALLSLAAQPEGSADPLDIDAEDAGSGRLRAPERRHREAREVAQPRLVERRQGLRDLGAKLVEIDLRPLRGALAAVSCPFPDSFAKRCRLGGAKEEALEYEVEDPAILW